MSLPQQEGDDKVFEEEAKDTVANDADDDKDQQPPQPPQSTHDPLILHGKIWDGGGGCCLTDQTTASNTQQIPPKPNPTQPPSLSFFIALSLSLSLVFSLMRFVPPQIRTAG